MTGCVNKVILIGTLQGAPLVRINHTGSAMVSFNLATSDKWKDRRTGAERVRVERHRIVVFNPDLVAVARDKLHNGSRTYLEGVLQTRKWTDEEGLPRVSIEIVLDHDRGALVPLDTAATSAAA
ncbi:single-strand DNA binding protein Ssb [Gluconacetobacter sacchari DSM 12717]|uniref:Single-stranded DNA-binding protein n=2 Tax=Gluconacetobacter sacchari TaxID=92759 RepID=A0A7W4IEV9_9PROT|nr:single-stranded DNA-binding protein [Gluconacetobacter sacchari]MBB2161613.1 single-stranded DNA-binding protein [Gluconacetobacter sacchari]GBQ21424.1 single-strand DNA binding protein Ssb [Gluconacetobacter sacchari DSM 12717]